MEGTERQIIYAKSIQEARINELKEKLVPQYGVDEFEWPEECCEYMYRLCHETNAVWFIETKDLELFEIFNF